MAPKLIDIQALILLVSDCLSFQFPSITVFHFDYASLNEL